MCACGVNACRDGEGRLRVDGNEAAERRHAWPQRRRISPQTAEAGVFVLRH